MEAAVLAEEQALAGGELLLVEDIVDKREDIDGMVLYLLRWRGRDATYNTWEPVSHIFDQVRRGWTKNPAGDTTRTELASPHRNGPCSQRFRLASQRPVMRASSAGCATLMQ